MGEPGVSPLECSRGFATGCQATVPGRECRSAATTGPVAHPTAAVLTILLVWVVPILWGALIGYFTNALAIRMLFRPLTRKYLLGIPVPLTPGIIPRRRGELARSIARMVARDLLSTEAVRARLQTETFRVALEAQIRHLRETLLQRPLPELAAHAGSALRGTDDGGELSWLELVRHLLQRLLVRLVGSRGFIYGVRSLVQRLVDEVAARRLHELIGVEQLTALVTGSLLPALGRAELRAQVSGLVKDWLHRQRAANVPLDRFLTPETTELLMGLFRRNLPALLDVLFTWLRGPRVRRELEVYGRAILRDVLDKLNLMQKVFITAGQYDRSLSERMPEIVTDVIDQAEAATAGVQVREQICGGARHALAQWSTRGLGDLAADSATRLDDLVDHLVARVFDALSGSDVADGAAAPAEEAVRRWYAHHGDATVAELAARYLGVQPVAVADFLANQLLGYLARPETGQQIAELVPALAGEALGGADTAAGTTTLAEVFAVPAATATRLDGVLTRWAIGFLSERLPSVMDTIDIQSLVVAKIDALDARQVEQLLLTVIARHLKWIKLFGAVIGAAIGLLLIALRAVSPGL